MLDHDGQNDSSVNVPLVVDIDGTLIRTDLLIESMFALAGHSPGRLLSLALRIGTGMAAIKAAIAKRVDIDVATLPYDCEVLAYLRQAKAAGRPVYLASASDAKYVGLIAAHLGVVDGWFASDGTTNLASYRKAERLVAAFGSNGFDYIGNDSADHAVWAVSRRRIAVRPTGPVRARLMASDPQALILGSRRFAPRRWLHQLRVHQWAKNLLVFLPLVTAQRFDLAALLQAAGAFLAFSFAASGIYIVNDLVDLDSDRTHPSKKYRPLATGDIPILAALVAAPLLLAAAVTIAALTSPPLAAVLLGYVLLTTAYSLSLKRKLLLDVIALAGLYTMRVIGGAAAAAVPISEWLLGFAMFLFTSLALMKRYVELAARLDADLPDPSNRNYRKSDLGIVAALAAASGFNAITVFALYISSETARHLYRQPQFLWLICPVLMYWLARALMMAHRRLMDDDPVVFAMTDGTSWIVAGLIGLSLLAAIR